MNLKCICTFFRFTLLITLKPAIFSAFNDTEFHISICFEYLIKSLKFGRMFNFVFRTMLMYFAACVRFFVPKYEYLHFKNCSSGVIHN